MNSNIIKSFSGHFYKSSNPEEIVKKMDEARDQNKFINLSTGKLVNDNSNWWIHPLLPLAIPRNLALDQEDANEIFKEYVNTHYIKWNQSEEKVEDESTDEYEPSEDPETEEITDLESEEEDVLE